MKFDARKLMAKGAATVLAVPILCLAIGNAPAFAANIQEAEPNNSYSTANAISVGDTVYAMGDSMDYCEEVGMQKGAALFSKYFDVYKVTVPSSGKISFTFGHENWIDAYPDLRMTVIDSNFNDLKYATIYGKDLNKGKVECTVKAGSVLYVGVESSMIDGDPREWADETYFIKTGYVVDAPSITKVKSGKKSFKVTHGINLTNTGYQIAYKKNGSSKWTTKVVKSATAKTFTAKKLAKKKAYKVKVRAFKTAGGKTYYSSWSAVKKVTTK